jgi:hypothetical protein
MKRLILGFALVSLPYRASLSHPIPWKPKLLHLSSCSKLSAVARLAFQWNLYRTVLPSPLLSKRVRPLPLLDTVLLAVIATF